MINFFQQVPATLYSACLTGFITAVSTLSGIFIANKANNERLHLQLEYERNEKQRELALSKLEELYVLFKQWEVTVLSTYIARISFMAEKFGYESILKMEKEIVERNKGDFNRLEMLVDLYFPRLKADYVRVLAVRDAANEIVSAHQDQYLSGDKNAKDLVPEFLKAQADFDQEAQKFIQLIADQAKNVLTE